MVIMSFEKDVSGQRPKNLREIEDIIGKATKKMGVKHENELCKYIPLSTGGYMHHFTLKKMKSKQPNELASIIERHIINNDKPNVFPPKARAARGSRKRRDQIAFTRQQLDRMLQIARQAGDKEIISVLSPRKSIAAYKRELIQSIRQGKIEQDLWNGYVESVNAQQVLLSSYAGN
jgi:hypothetical protein